MANPAKQARDNAQAQWPGALVVNRKRNSIKHRHPTAPSRFMLDAGIGPMHYGPLENLEIDTEWQAGTAPWDYEMVKAGYNAFALEDFSAGQIIKYVHPDSGEDIAFQPQQLQYTNDLDQIQAIENPQAVNAVATDDVLYWTGAYGTDIDLKWECQTARLDKRLIIDNLAALPAVQAFITAGGNPVLRFQLIFQKSSGVEIYINDVLWNEQSGNPVETSGHIEFRLQGTGEILWSFNLPLSFQQTDTPQFVGTFRLRKTGPNLFVEHRISVSWIQTAVYPIEIDVTVDEQVGAGIDDAYNYDAGSFDSTNAFYNLMGDFAAEAFDAAGFRFSSVTIADGVTIDVAYLIFEPYQTDSGAITYTWYGADIASPPIFSTTEPEDITQTTANTVENPPASWTADTTVNSDSIVGIIQELEDSYDYSGGSAIVIVAFDGGGTGERLPKTYENDTSLAAILHIEYTAGPTTAEERRCVVGTHYYMSVGVTPNAAKDQEWRQEAGYGYCGILAAGVVAGQPVYKRSQGIPTGPGYRDRPGKWN